MPSLMPNGSASRTYYPVRQDSLEPRQKTTGCSWMQCSTATEPGDLPERFGDFRVVHTRHSRWSQSGVWQRVFEALAQDADNEYAMIDATIVRAHQHSAGAKGGIRTSRPSVVAEAA